MHRRRRHREPCATRARVAVTNDGDRNDDDETLIVTEFYRRARIRHDRLRRRQPGGAATPAASAACGAYNVSDLAPHERDRLSADRQRLRPSTDPPDAPTVMTAPNQLYAAAVQAGSVYVTSVSASPEPPIDFQPNVFPVLYVGDLATGHGGSSNVGIRQPRAAGRSTRSRPTRRAASCRRSSTSPSTATRTSPYVVSRAARHRAARSPTIRPRASSLGTDDDLADVDIARPTARTRSAIAVAPTRRRAYVNCWINAAPGRDRLSTAQVARPQRRNRRRCRRPATPDDVRARRTLLLHRTRRAGRRTADGLLRRAAPAIPTA